MKEVEIHFKGQGRDGVVPVGSYLIDAAKRMGVQGLPECTEAGSHSCFFDIEGGFELLSEISEVEAELLREAKLSNKARLGCFAKIERPGVIVVMAKERIEDEPKNQGQENEEEKYREEFTALPLEKKISTLMQLEAIALSETVAYVMNSPFTIADKIGDVLAEFGFKKEEDQKKKKRPETETVNGEPVTKEKSKPAPKVKKPKNGSKSQG